jgi:hypothetical protein
MNSISIKPVILLFAVTTIIMAGCGRATHWPIDPVNDEHRIANSASEYQKYAGSPYLHRGIDIREAPYPGGPSIRAVCESTVDISESGSSIYHGIILTQSDGSSDDGSEYWYWHIEWESIPPDIHDAWDYGTEIADNDILGKIVAWPACGFHHLHFNRYNPDGESYDPAVYIKPHKDNSSPEVQNIYFCEDGTNNYFSGGPAGFVVNGDVDIVAQIRDRLFSANWNAGGHSFNTGVYTIKYTIDEAAGDHDLSETFAWFFRIPDGSKASIIYKTAGAYISSSAYCGTEQYFYIVTNQAHTDPMDDEFTEDGCWDTDSGGFPNGLYNVTVTAIDIAGNEGSLTVQAWVNN